MAPNYVCERKILYFVSSHYDVLCMEKMSADLGYSKDELVIMLSYFVKQAKAIEKKEKLFKIKSHARCLIVDGYRRVS